MADIELGPPAKKAALHPIASLVEPPGTSNQGESDEIVNTRTSLFREVVEQSGFVDKTLLIDKILPKNKSRGSRIYRITAPRRFGKSTILNMIKCFLEVQGELVKSTENYKLFDQHKDKLQVMNTEYEEKRDLYFGKLPVLYIDLKCNASLRRVKDVTEFFERCVSNAFCQHEYLETSLKLKQYEKDICERWIKMELRKHDKFYSGLLKLSEFLRRHHSDKVYVLIDEYDSIISHALQESEVVLQDACKNLDAFMSALLKSNDVNLFGGVITGIMQLTPTTESPFNNVFKILFLDGSMFTEYYGMTDKETADLITRLGMDEKTLANIKRKYNGYYSKNNVNLYATWSVLNCLIHFSINPSQAYDTHWCDSGYVTTVESVFKSNPLKGVIEMLLRGDTMAFVIQKELSLEHLNVFRKFDTNPNDLDVDLFASFLLQQGYLTYVENNRDHFKIPNDEIVEMFRSKLIKHYTESIPADFLSALRNESCQLLQLIEEAARESDERFKIEIENFRPKLEKLFEKYSKIVIKMNEAAIHHFMSHIVSHAGTYKLGSELPVVKSDGSKSRLDKLIINQKHDFAIVFEYKFDRGNGGNDAHVGLKQMIDLEYANVLKNNQLGSEASSISSYILMAISINDKKQVSVKCLRNNTDVDKAVYVSPL